MDTRLGSTRSEKVELLEDYQGCVAFVNFSFSSSSCMPFGFFILFFYFIIIVIHSDPSLCECLWDDRFM